MRIIPTKYPTLHTGITGNKYIVCSELESLQDVCRRLGKSVNSIRWVERYNAYVVRLKNRQHKQKAIEIMPE